MWQSFLNYLPIADTSQQQTNFLRPKGFGYSEVSLYYENVESTYIEKHLQKTASGNQTKLKQNLVEKRSEK